jgi:hypothetical protein
MCPCSICVVECPDIMPGFLLPIAVINTVASPSVWFVIQRRCISFTVRRWPFGPTFGSFCTVSRKHILVGLNTNLVNININII